MSIANKAGWPDTFTVASSVLGLRSGLNASALKRARNKLATDGFIEWKSRGGNQSAQYRLISLVVQNQHKNEPQFEPQSEPQNEPQFEPQSEPINKLKHKHNISVSDNTRMEPCTRFGEFWNLYPKQKNRFLAEQEYAVLIASTKELTEEQLLAAVKNYAETCQIKKTREQYIKNPENWLKDSAWVDYLPENYQRPTKVDTGEKGSRNKFNDFPQRNYNYDDLEKQLLNARG